MEAKTTDLEKFQDRTLPTAVVPVSGHYDNLIEIALTKDAGIEILEKLMDLKERDEANKARKAYVRAMAAFKESPPEILKNKKAGFDHKDGQGRTEYSYAGLDQVAEEIGKALSKHGLSASWKTEQSGKIKVTCTITHEMGHSESASLEADADQSGKKNAIQAIGQDDDGKGSEPEALITEEECADLDALLKEVNADMPKFFKVFEIKELSKLPAKQYKKAVKMAEGKRKNA